MRQRSSRIVTLAIFSMLLSVSGNVFLVQAQAGELVDAAKAGDLAKVEQFLEKGADVNERGEFQDTPLHEAAGGGNYDVAKFLIEKGADVNARNSVNYTPLHFAARGVENIGIVKLLIEKGADVNARGDDQLTPVRIAEQKNADPGLIAMLRAPLAGVTPDQKLQQYISLIKSQPDNGPVCKEEFSTNNRGDVSSSTVCHLFATDIIREEIIGFVSAMKPSPPVPDQAQRYFVQGNTLMKSANNAADYNLAIDKYKEALMEAPWWGDAYYNLGVALESAGRYDDAIDSLKLYLLTNPPTADEDKKKIYAIEAKKEKADQEKKNSQDLLRKINGARFVYRSHGTIAMTGAPADFMDTLDVLGDTITVGQGLASGQDWSANGGITYKIEGQKVHCFANGKAIPQGDGILADDGSTIRFGDHIYQRER